jgi:hypoxanthine phosphoribosyltransferase
MAEFIPVLTQDEIRRLVSRLAERLSADYRDREVVLIGILKGAFVFLSDLIRQMTIPLKVDFLCASSYGSGMESTQQVRLSKGIDIDIRDRDVILVEDIVDSGITLAYLVDYVKSFHPKSLKICALLDKRERRASVIHIDYAGCVVKEGFLVGYGLDYAEDYRNLPEIYHLKV